MMRIKLIKNVIRYCSTVESNTKISFSRNPADRYELKTEHINELKNQIPSLQKYNTNLWLNFNKLLTNQGFTTIGVLKIITKYPDVLILPSESLLKSLECFRVTQFGDRNLCELIEEYPEFLKFMNETELRKRIAFLKSYAVTQNNIYKLFLNSPNLLYDRIGDIKEKMKFIDDNIQADIYEIVNSSIFSHSLDKIKCRYAFVERLGLYKKKKEKTDQLKNTNPKIYLIVDTSDKRFATKVCFVTLEEYEVFKELFEREQNEKGLGFDIDNDDDDNEDDDNDEIKNV